MDTLWAPWRIEYILSERPEGCIFCTKPPQKKDRENLIVVRRRSCYVIMNYYPYNNGHLMVVPYRHVAELGDLDHEEQCELMKLLAESIEVLKRQLSPQGFNVGMNLGKVAGAGIDDHLHMHVVPRWTADTNFMPVLGHTRVVPEALQATCEQLRGRFAMSNTPAPRRGQSHN